MREHLECSPELSSNGDNVKSGSSSKKEVMHQAVWFNYSRKNVGTYSTHIEYLMQPRWEYSVVIDYWGLLWTLTQSMHAPFGCERGSCCATCSWCCKQWKVMHRALSLTAIIPSRWKALGLGGSIVLLNSSNYWLPIPEIVVDHVNSSVFWSYVSLTFRILCQVRTTVQLLGPCVNWYFTFHSELTKSQMVT